MSVYNIIWADDDIDALEVSYKKRFFKNGLRIIGKAHNGDELEQCLSKQKNIVDAVIVDANFNESLVTIDDERDTSGLSFTRNHLLRQYPSIPFFLFTQRDDELINEKYRNSVKFRDEFPRHQRWFHKNDDDELMELFESIGNTVEEMKSPSFIVRNRYYLELETASLFEDSYDFILDFLVHDYNNTLEEIKEPFASVRRYIEKIFGQCEKMNIIPPVSDNTNGVANYFLHNKFTIKEGPGKYKIIYEMLGGNIMPKPLAQSLDYIVCITQDGAHSKNELNLKVDKYFKETKDALMLRSVVFILMDVIKWFATTALSHQNYEENKQKLWRAVE